MLTLSSSYLSKDQSLPNDFTLTHSYYKCQDFSFYISLLKHSKLPAPYYLSSYVSHSSQTIMSWSEVVELLQVQALESVLSITGKKKKNAPFSSYRTSQILSWKLTLYIQFSVPPGKFGCTNAAFPLPFVCLQYRHIYFSVYFRKYKLLKAKYL